MKLFHILLLFFFIFAVSATSDLFSQQGKPDVYKLAIKTADSIYAAGDLEAAKGAYYYASRLTSDNYPVKQIEKIDIELNKVINNMVDFERFFRQGNKAFSDGDRNNAVLLYEKALGFVNDTALRRKLDGIKDVLAKEQMILMKFNVKMDSARKEVVNKHYYNAFSLFNDAAKIKPDELSVDDNITKMRVRIIEEYGVKKDILAKADSLYDAKEYRSALVLYGVAFVLDPSDVAMLSKYKELDNIVDYYSGLKKDFDNFVKKGDAAFALKDYSGAEKYFADAIDIFPDENYPKEQLKIAQQLAYNAANSGKFFKEYMDEGNRLLALGDLYGALERYKSALNLKPSDVGAKSKIDLVSGRISDVDNLLLSYNRMVADADTSYIKRKFDRSLSLFESAVELRNRESKIRLGDNSKIFLDNNLYVIDVSYSNQRITELKDIIAVSDKKFMEKKIAADSEFQNKGFDNALALYKEALFIKPEDSYVSGKIAEINSLIKTEIDKINSDYSKALADAEAFMASEQYKSAIVSFGMAKEIKPDSAPQIDLRINEAKILMTDAKQREEKYKSVMALANTAFISENLNEAKAMYNEALSYKPGDVIAKGRINEINLKINSIETLEFNYQTAIKSADSLFALKRFSDALPLFKEALTLKPSEKYPSDRIGVIEVELANIKKIDETYNLFINEADALFDVKRYKNAIDKYAQASLLKPSEKYPSNQIAAINVIVDEIDRKNSEFKLLISDADGKFSTNDYQAALLLYKKALELIPDDQYAVSKFNETDLIIKDIQRKDELYASSIADGDRFLKDDEYEQAKESFEIALSVRPDDVYAKDKLAESLVLIKNNPKVARETYQRSMAEGSDFEAAGNYLKAFEAYRNAYMTGIDNVNATSKINQCAAKLKENTLSVVSNKNIKLFQNTSIRLDFKPVTSSKRDLSYLLVRADNLNGVAGTNIVINFGSGYNLSGGVLIDFVNEKGAFYYLFDLSSNSNWIKNENSWMTVLAEDGDVNVEEIIIVGK